MNKLKWIPLNEEIKVDYPMAMDINKNVVQFVHFDKNVVFLFINNYMVVLRFFRKRVPITSITFYCEFFRGNININFTIFDNVSLIR